jgi:hypothetical protein
VFQKQKYTRNTSVNAQQRKERENMDKSNLADLSFVYSEMRTEEDEIKKHNDKME